MSSPAGPNVAQITLPPGYTLEQFHELQGKIGEYVLNLIRNFSYDVPVNIAIGMAVAVSLAVWDLCVNFQSFEIALAHPLQSLSMIPEERKLLRIKDKNLWRKPSSYA